MHSYGDIDYQKRLIRINKKKSKKNPGRVRPVNKYASKYPDILDSIIHECMHRQYPKMTEKKIRKKVLAKVKEFSKRQKAKYYNKIK